MGYTVSPCRRVSVSASRSPASLRRISSGVTGFIDQVPAHDLLPDDLKAEAEGLHIVYQLCVSAGGSGTAPGAKSARSTQANSRRPWGPASTRIIRRSCTYGPKV